ncbi:MAG: helix-turn-helix transcriptional regulator [Prevotella sp.]|nr:helix-turn-helix transcriptional regulator [Prevotella sp.]
MTRDFVTDPLFPECPIRNILSRIGEKWCLLVLLNLARKENNNMRFNELSKAIPDISQRMLTATLRSLEADGLIDRKQYAEIPPRVEYSLTDRALTLIPLLNPIVEWSINNYKSIVANRKRTLGVPKK